ncbi:MAG: ParA family protein [Pseudonocardia sp.]
MSSQSGDRPRVLGVGSPKGGVGKTQTAVTLAHLASRAGYRVLLVDADENRSAEDWVMRAGDRIALDVATERDPRNLVRLHDLRDLDLIVVDLPGARTSDAWSALLNGADGTPVVDALVVPSAVRTMDLRAVLRVVHGPIEKAGVPYLLVGTLVKTPSLPNAMQDLNEIAAGGVQVARQIIRDLSVHADAVREDRPLTDMPGGRHSTARAAEREYRSLAAEVFALLGVKWPAELPDLPPATTDTEEE